MNDQKEKTFILYWYGGEEEKVKGRNITNVIDKAGYGGGVICNLDYYSVLMSKKGINKKDLARKC